jgi:hypothetical protein
MKGIIFTEFMTLVEDKFGLDVLDDILDMSDDEGVYTSVGSYDHRDLVKLIVNLSKKTEIDAGTLQQVFGQTVFKALLNSMQMNAEVINSSGTFDFIKSVEDYIHVEVKKLYPDAKPPNFHFISETDNQLVFDYESARCMSHVCMGLIKGCADNFNEELEVTMEPQTEDGSLVRFTLVKVG